MDVIVCKSISQKEKDKNFIKFLFTNFHRVSIVNNTTDEICNTIGQYITDYGYLKPEQFDKEFDCDGLLEYLEEEWVIEELLDGNLLFHNKECLTLADIFVTSYNTTSEELAKIVSKHVRKNVERMMKEAKYEQQTGGI